MTNIAPQGYPVVGLRNCFLLAKTPITFIPIPKTETTSTIDLLGGPPSGNKHQTFAECARSVVNSKFVFSYVCNPIDRACSQYQWLLRHPSQAARCPLGSRARRHTPSSFWESVTPDEIPKATRLFWPQRQFLTIGGNPVGQISPLINVFKLEQQENAWQWLADVLDTPKLTMPKMNVSKLGKLPLSEAATTNITDLYSLDIQEFYS